MNVTTKFTLALVGGILLVHVASGVIRVERERELFEQDISRDARVLGRALGHAVERAWSTRGEDAALDLVRHANGRESHVLIRWVSLQANDAQPLSAAERSALQQGSTVVHRTDETLYTYVPVAAGRGAIEVADPLADENAYLARSVRNTALSTLVLVLLCALLSWVLGVRLIGRPVARLVERARAIGRGDLAGRLDMPGRDELAILATEVNQMSAELELAQRRVEDEGRARLAAMEQLRHADRLTSIGTLASGVAHELGTPLNVVDGYAQLIREDPSASTKAKESSLIISRQCKRMTEIIRQLLEFARRGTIGAAESDPVEVAEDTARMVAPLLRKQRIEMSIEGPPDLGVQISGGRLQQVLVNLTINAIHAMPDGGTLRIRVEDEGETARLTLEDDGCGMDAETAGRIFEPFFTTKDVGDGTGLGLSVAYGIIEDHHGHISVESEPERGTRFTITLPRARPPSGVIAALDFAAQ